MAGPACSPPFYAIILNMDTKDKKKTSKKAKAAGAAAAAVIVASTAVAGAFDSVDDLAQAAAMMPPQTEIVQMVDMDTGVDIPDDEDATDEKQKGIRAWIRRRVLSLPRPVRVAVGVPLYALGCGILQIMDLIWIHLLSPIARTLVKYLILAAVVFGATAIILKLLYPERKLKEFFTKKNIAGMLISIAAVFGFEKVIDFVWPDHMPWTNMLLFAGGLVVFSVLLGTLLGKAAKLEPQG